MTRITYKYRPAGDYMQKRHICLRNVIRHSRAREWAESAALAVLLFLSCCAWGVV